MKKITLDSEKLYSLIVNNTRIKNYAQYDIPNDVFISVSNKLTTNTKTHHGRMSLLDFFINYCNANQLVPDIPELFYNSYTVAEFARCIRFTANLPPDVSEIFLSSTVFDDSYAYCFLNIKPDISLMNKLLIEAPEIIEKYFSNMVRFVCCYRRLSIEYFSSIFDYISSNYSDVLMTAFVKKFIKSGYNISIKNITAKWIGTLYDMCANDRFGGKIKEENIDSKLFEIFRIAIEDNCSTKQLLQTSLFTDGVDIIKKLFAKREKNYNVKPIRFSCANFIDALIGIGIPEKDIAEKIVVDANINTFIKRDYFSDDFIRDMLLVYKDGNAMNMLAEYRPDIFSENFKEYIETLVQSCLARSLPKSAKYLVEQNLVTINTNVDVDPEAITLFLSLKNLDEGK